MIQPLKPIFIYFLLICLFFFALSLLLNVSALLGSIYDKSSCFVNVCVMCDVLGTFCV